MRPQNVLPPAIRVAHTFHLLKEWKLCVYAVCKAFDLFHAVCAYNKNAVRCWFLLITRYFQYLLNAERGGRCLAWIMSDWEMNCSKGNVIISTAYPFKQFVSFNSGTAQDAIASKSRHDSFKRRTFDLRAVTNALHAWKRNACHLLLMENPIKKQILFCVNNKIVSEQFCVHFITEN